MYRCHVESFQKSEYSILNIHPNKTVNNLYITSLAIRNPPNGNAPSSKKLFPNIHSQKMRSTFLKRILTSSQDKNRDADSNSLAFLCCKAANFALKSS
ncbi:hypothetical protein DLM77_13060 [Leptospira yasudae]|uniref:Uncharacterized protein n=1 Tax=Leptospira yasudae TaxID=2202201 RepID=A0ABX9M1J0_9LEPT|nr:hypothetical protein DLM77_13060 [Leptospira yasudae]